MVAVVFSVRVKFSWLCAGAAAARGRQTAAQGWIGEGWLVGNTSPADVFALSTTASRDRKPLIADKQQQRS